MRRISEIPNTRAIEVSFLPVTNYRGERVKFKDDYRDKETIIVSYSYLFGGVQSQVRVKT